MKKTGKIWVALITALSLAMPMNVWADTKITSISLKIDSSIEAGDSDSDVYVTTSSRYCSAGGVTKAEAYVRYGEGNKLVLQADVWGVSEADTERLKTYVRERCGEALVPEVITVF